MLPSQYGNGLARMYASKKNTSGNCTSKSCPVWNAMDSGVDKKLAEDVIKAVGTDGAK